MNELNLVFPDLPYAVEEAMNRLRARGNTVELIRIGGEAAA